MAQLPTPLQSTFPNLVEALEELMPLLCTLLVGFEGLIFVSVATLHDKLPDVMFEPLLGLYPKMDVIFDARSLILILSGIASSLLYFCVIAMVYSRMSRYSCVVNDDMHKLDAETMHLIHQRMNQLEARRFTCAILTLFLYNSGVLFIIATGFSFAPPYIFSLFTEFFMIIWFANIAFIYLTWRRHHLSG